MRLLSSHWFYTHSFFFCLSFFIRAFVCACFFLCCVSFLIHFCAFIAMYWLPFHFHFWFVLFITNTGIFILVVYRAHKPIRSHSFVRSVPHSFPHQVFSALIFFSFFDVHGTDRGGFVFSSHHWIVPVSFLFGCWFAWNSRYWFRCIKHLGVWCKRCVCYFFVARHSANIKNIVYYFFFGRIILIYFLLPFVLFHFCCVLSLLFIPSSYIFWVSVFVNVCIICAVCLGSIPFLPRLFALILFNRRLGGIATMIRNQYREKNEKRRTKKKYTQMCSLTFTTFNILVTGAIKFEREKNIIRI